MLKPTTDQSALHKYEVNRKRLEEAAARTAAARAAVADAERQLAESLADSAAPSVTQPIHGNVQETKVQLELRESEERVYRQAVEIARENLETMRAMMATPERIAAFEAEVVPALRGLNEHARAVVDLAAKFETELKYEASRLLGQSHPLFADLPWAVLDSARRQLESWLSSPSLDESRWREPDPPEAKPDPEPESIAKRLRAIGGKR